MPSERMVVDEAVSSRSRARDAHGLRHQVQVAGPDAEADRTREHAGDGAGDSVVQPDGRGPMTLRSAISGPPTMASDLGRARQPAVRKDATVTTPPSELA